MNQNLVIKGPCSGSAAWFQLLRLRCYNLLSSFAYTVSSCAPPIRDPSGAIGDLRELHPEAGLDSAGVRRIDRGRGGAAGGHAAQRLQHRVRGRRRGAGVYSRPLLSSTQAVSRTKNPKQPKQPLHTTKHPLHPYPIKSAYVELKSERVKVPGGGQLSGKLAATHFNGGAVFSDLAVSANMESDVYLKGTATIGSDIQTRHLYVAMLAGPARCCPKP
jgi:hypothetical protein